jgi:hypothetical protein
MVEVEGMRRGRRRGRDGIWVGKRIALQRRESYCCTN